MKRYLTIALSLALMLVLVSCGAAAAGSTSQPDGPAGLPEAAGSAGLTDASQEDFDHQPFQGDNIIPHEQMLYCGNTITQIYPESRYTGEDWKASFWGGDSVELSDLLLYLDYQEGICRCLPEYMVETEFSEEPYGINLTEGYVRHGDSQVDLTREQVELIQGILDRNLPD